MKAWVGEYGLDALVSTDGDADRPLLVDETGDILPGDIMGPIAARWCGADEVVTTVSANTLVDLLGTFGSVARTKIGSPYVIAEMEARAAGGATKIVGYEPNGGFLLGWDISGDMTLPKLMTRDSVLPMVATIAASVDAGRSLSGLLADFPERRTAADRLKDVPREVSLQIVEGILGGESDVLPERLGQPVAIDQTDGVRMRFANGQIVHIRPSGNAPELRCYVEAESASAATAVLAEALSNLRAAVTLRQS